MASSGGAGITPTLHRPPTTPHSSVLTPPLAPFLPTPCPLSLSGFLSSWLLFVCLGSLACRCVVCLCVSSSGCSVLLVWLFCSLACFLCVPCLGSPCSCCPPMSMCLCSWFLGCGSCVLSPWFAVCLCCSVRFISVYGVYLVCVSLVGACVLCPCCSIVGCVLSVLVCVVLCLLLIVCCVLSLL